MRAGGFEYSTILGDGNRVLYMLEIIFELYSIQPPHTECPDSTGSFFVTALQKYTLSEVKINKREKKTYI